ncbi:MAG: IclR family transcriptional regulator [Desulfatiglandaceae bacterium]|jgi:IclR family acetate operon transcriptional repressor
MEQKHSTHLSIERALDILMAFMPHNQELGTQEISLKMGLHKSTVNRLLHVLNSRGFLQQNTVTKKFRLGSSIVHLGGAAAHSLNDDLTKIAMPFLDELRERVGETVVLEAASSEDTVIAYLAEGRGPVRIKGNIGNRHKYNAAAGAKAILAFSESEFVDRILAGKLHQQTPNSITDRIELLEEMKRTKEQGFSFEKEENNIGISAFGCPIFNWEGKPVAAAVVAGPSQSIMWERRLDIVPLLMETASTISERLYHIKGDRNDISQRLSDWGDGIRPR